MRLVIIGAGSAGMYAAFSAARLRDIRGAGAALLSAKHVVADLTLGLGTLVHDYLRAAIVGDGTEPDGKFSSKPTPA
jgi:hypothetical protein